jgi:hypothetical protein
MTAVQLYLIVFALLAAQTPPPQSKPSEQKPQAETSKVDPADLPVSLDRIQRALAKTPKLQFDTEQKPVFRVQVFGEKPTIEEILGEDFGKGPVPYGGMTHQEFLTMVTPKDFQGYAGLSNKEGATLAATSFLLQWTLQKALVKYRETRDEREREAARKEVLDALNALEQARAKAGLPKK